MCLIQKKGEGKTMGVKNMQGVPAHLEYLPRKGKRRHLARCKFILKPEKICDCTSSPYFRNRCGGASRCDYYFEREEDK